MLSLSAGRNEPAGCAQGMKQLLLFFAALAAAALMMGGAYALYMLLI